MSEFVAFDLETTGLSPKTDEIIEIGAVRFVPGAGTIAEFDVLVDPGIPIPLAIERLTGIGTQQVQGAPTPGEAVAQFADFCDGAQLVAHGSGFDVAFCAGLVPGAFAGRAVMDTLELARIIMPLAASHSLPLLSRALGIGHDRPHRADSDAFATRDLFLRLIDDGNALPADVRMAIHALASGLAVPMGTFFRDLTAPGAAPVPIRVSSQPPAAPPSPGRPAAGGQEKYALPDAIPVSVAVAEVLGPDGPLAATPGYEYRAGQIEMARAVAQTLERSGRLLVEAGTGVGKSFAYLAPLMLWTARTRRRAVVATNTVTLQEQLADADAPALLAHLEAPVRVAMLKGRQHYISLRRWRRFLASDDTSGHAVDIDRVRFKLKVLVWLAQTTTGDRAELRLASVEEPLWRLVESDTDDCLGSACGNWRTGACHMVAARRRAAEASVVITNHSLLLADAERQGRVLDTFDALVIDEAHRFEEAATKQLGASMRSADVLAILERLPHGEAGEALDDALARCHDAVVRVFGETKAFLAAAFGTDQPANGTVGLTTAVREQAAFTALLRAAGHGVSTLRRTSDALLALRGGPVAASWAGLPQPGSADDELSLAAAALEEAAAVIDRIVCRPREGHVAWLQLRAEQAELHDAPVHVGEILGDTVFGRVAAAVLTSATLTVGDSFGFVRERTGIGGGAAELSVPSPFDFLAQALSIVPGDIPAYDDEGYDAAMSAMCMDIAERLGGRTLVLFTGYAPLRRVHALIRTRLESKGIVVLGQGLDGTRKQILAGFLANPRTMLLGTSTFWEGIDVAGEALSCVVIAKLPFPVPTDPLVQARGAHLTDPFGELALPIAVLRLKQGFGRLIRRTTDRGAVVLCDARISSREYGRRFIEALPPANVVSLPLDGVGRTVEEFVRTGAIPEGGPVRRIGTSPDTTPTWQADEPA